MDKPKQPLVLIKPLLVGGVVFVACGLFDFPDLSDLPWFCKKLEVDVSDIGASFVNATCLESRQENSRRLEYNFSCACEQGTKKWKCNNTSGSKWEECVYAPYSHCIPDVSNDSNVVALANDLCGWHLPTSVP